MKTLIAEDDYVSRVLLQKILGVHGPYQLVEDGAQAVEAVRVALRTRQPYDLICLDIMMPRMDGHRALKEIRALEEAHGLERDGGAKVIMTTALADRDNVIRAGQMHCDAYLVKPIGKARLLDELHRLELIPPDEEQGDDAAGEHS